VLAAVAAAATIHVALQDRLQARPVEGYIWFVRLDGRPARAVRGAVQIDLRATRGPHRLESFIRTCDGNCGYLDPPSLRCVAHVRAPARVTVRLTNAGCKVLP
jgi:hypothetical protein